MRSWGAPPTRHALDLAVTRSARANAITPRPTSLTDPTNDEVIPSGSMPSNPRSLDIQGQRAANAPQTVIYTAMFGNYDHVPAPRIPWGANLDVVCFTDSPRHVPRAWHAVEVQREDASPVLANRRYKILPHRYLPHHSTSIYVDARIGIRADPRVAFEPYLASANVVIPRHRYRNCVYDEANACVDAGKANAGEVAELVARFEREGLPTGLGLPENGVVVRRHHVPEVVALMEAWWSELNSGVLRDQLYLPYLAWRTRTPLGVMDETFDDLTRYFRLFPHRSALRGARGAIYTLLAQNFANPIGRALDAVLERRKRRGVRSS